MTYYQPEGLAETIFKDRYTVHAEETWENASRRVSNHVASDEDADKREAVEEEFFEEIVTNRFMPGGRIWYGSGRPRSQLLNCFVLSNSETMDSREGWGKTIHDVIVISGMGGGIGVNCSPVRPRGSKIHGTGGIATGAVSLMQMINAVGDVLVGGGGRRLALMLDLNMTHPDMPEFLNKKLDKNELNNANVSVIIDKRLPAKEFISKVRNGEEFDLVWKNTFDRSVNAKDIWETIVHNAWASGEPGVLNGDLANKENNLWYYKPLVSTNPSMPKGILVATEEGIFPIESLEGKKFRVKSLDGVWADASCWLSSEDAEVLEFQFSDHITTASTKEHRWPVYEDGQIVKKYASELKEGDLIPLNRNEPTGIMGDLSLTEEQGFFLGYSFGDGWVSERKSGKETGKKVAGLTFASNEKEMAERLVQFANTHKKRQSKVNISNKGEINFQTTAQNFIREFMYETKDSLPQKIWTSNDSYIRGFVDGLLSSDGSVYVGDSQAYINYTTSRENVAKEFSKLLSFYGIRTTIHTQTTSNIRFPNGKTYDKSYTRWDVRISGNAVFDFMNVFTISHTEKYEKIQQILSKTFRPHRGTQYAEIKKITQIDNQPVWDISVDYEQHVFPSQYVYTGNCGEIWLEEYGSCDLGALVLPRFLDDFNQVDWAKLKKTIHTAVRFLDNVLSVNEYPLPEVRNNCTNVRRLGLGIMGLHDMLIKMGYRYSSNSAKVFVSMLMAFIKEEAYLASTNLAAEKGPFPAYQQEFLESGFVRRALPSFIKERIALNGIRNCALLTIAPTGTTGMVSNVSTGIEPIFSAAYWRRFYRPTEDGSKYLDKEIVLNPHWDRIKKEGGDLNLLEGAYDVTPEDHFEMQHICQAEIDNAVSKTINLPKSTTPDSLGELWLNYLPFVKGTTFYREGSRDNEPQQAIPLVEAQRLVAQSEKTAEASIIDQNIMDCVGDSCEIPEEYKPKIQTVGVGA